MTTALRGRPAPCGRWKTHRRGMRRPPAGVLRGSHGPIAELDVETGAPTMRKVFTTGQVAKIWKVAPRTVSKWFDSGRLVGYRIPGSQDRRIPREHLIRFLKEHQMPLGELEDEAYSKVLIIGTDRMLIDRLMGSMPEDDDFKVEI